MATQQKEILLLYLGVYLVVRSGSLLIHTRVCSVRTLFSTSRNEEDPANGDKSPARGRALPYGTPSRFLKSAT